MKTAYPVYMEADVVVCGGGTAGAFAAIAAAEQGKKVLVIEKETFGGVSAVSRDDQTTLEEKDPKQGGCFCLLGQR